MSLPTLILAVVPITQWSLISTLLVTAGIAFSLNTWTLPIIKLNPTTTSIPQLLDIGRIGGRTLDPANIAVALVLVFVSVVQAQYPSFAVATSWKVPASASFMLFQVAWWEKLTIFPLERAAIAMKERLEGEKASGQGVWMGRREREEFHGLLDRWGVRHLGRAVPPVIAVGRLVVWRG
ncbi:hypothetical protein CLAFUW4_07536 [Fulvia fulva]|uniref:Uncharacterized protein n=1 Tax=Passalora fulva TaxID=5499 RepID=A0A9Q8PBQ4_PASFU|nr:uncharacterized protein CLAFUR5_07666 [Fulvia fulva]KAK4621834.1 hypothetical protein CLAFUR4_07542 [Fulvia fulva]UJO19472.1 hypothetical protein CLAFUR5_07666 [Fulvia fulva]WPV16811.1 hypothetical protein CLAFUW4_07536 [Fulvia fulva]WPV30965.1 hypothetical protein CLAFUW7_07538 [Fulvia fulva]